ncbi:protein-ER retention protein [Coemansia erecta]|uniref:Protein-ER retention protein n=1 Tax=Coemansia erecta TaxID=147472 RepID=A0A9W7Y3I2_9FUNG|nr:protein-ER retention protein [Coemansia erecta]
MYFPVAFQVLFLSLLAAFGWGANLRYLSLAGIEVRPILQLSELPTAAHSDRESGIPEDELHTNIFRLAGILGGVSLVGWALCVLESASPGMQTFVTLITYLFIVAIIVMPRRTLCHTARMQFVESLVRIVKPSMTDPVFLSDVIMADILTSCARMFADLLLVLCRFTTMLRYSRRPGLDPANDGGVAELIERHRNYNMCTDAGIFGAVLVAMPYMFRLRQCINEYLRAEVDSSDRRRHFANAVKYASSIPVICLSSTQRRVAVDGIMETKYSDWMLRLVYSLWILAVAFNSLYSYYWDIAFDWNLGHLSNGSKLSDIVVPVQQPSPRLKTPAALVDSDDEESNTNVNTRDLDAASQPMPGSWAADPSLFKRKGFPFLLRPRLCFGPPQLYYIAMVIDFLLRITWTTKLTSYIQIDRMAYGGFWLNLLEIYRRWQWTFLRIEKEAAIL